MGKHARKCFCLSKSAPCVPDWKCKHEVGRSLNKRLPDKKIQERQSVRIQQLSCTYLQSFARLSKPRSQPPLLSSSSTLPLSWHLGLCALRLFKFLPRTIHKVGKGMIVHQKQENVFCSHRDKFISWSSLHKSRNAGQIKLSLTIPLFLQTKIKGFDDIV